MSLCYVLFILTCMSTCRVLAINSKCPSDCDAFQLADPPMPEVPGSTSASIGKILINMVIFAGNCEKT